MKKYLAIFKINLLNSLAYPAEIATRGGMILVFMVVFFQLWHVTYAASGSQVINSLTLHDTMWYLLLTETIELGRPRLARVISEQVKDGSIAYLLNKPYDFLLYQFSLGLGESLPRMGMLFILGSALVWAMAGPPPDLKNWPLAFITLAIAWLLHFCVNVLIGLAAFVAEEVAPFEWIYQKLVFILGGMLIPLDFYPAWLQALAKSLPFAYMMYGPARLFVRPDMTLFIQIIAGQLLWLVVLGGLLVLTFSRGIRRLAINGG
ncbi:MAG: ABC-2 family transporter protein [Anaerolineales bacterium]|jgi:ABC-2 type transport system permease protein